MGLDDQRHHLSHRRLEGRFAAAPTGKGFPHRPPTPGYSNAALFRRKAMGWVRCNFYVITTFSVAPVHRTATGERGASGDSPRPSAVSFRTRLRHKPHPPNRRSSWRSHSGDPGVAQRLGMSSAGLAAIARCSVHLPWRERVVGEFGQGSSAGKGLANLRIPGRSGQPTIFPLLPGYR